MRKAILAFTAVFTCIVVLFCSVVSFGALDTAYEVDELGLSLKIPREYTVITRHTERGANEFAKLGLDYDGTMTAFHAADIYLQAVRDDNLLKITLSMVADENSKSINNYSELTQAQRQSVLDSFLQDSTYTSGVEVKHNDIIYFDLGLTKENFDKTIYGYQCNTVVNGMNINLSIQKDNEQLTADEIKVITNVVGTVSFDRITLSSGPSFEWWRILLWIFILAVISVATLLFFRRQERIKRERAQQRRERRKAARPIEDVLHFDDNVSDVTAQPESKKSLLSALGFDSDDIDDGSDLSIDFEDTLGYDTTDYKDRIASDFDSLDINVRQKDPSSGVSFFEDSGQSINDNVDYFDNYFKEQIKPRPAHKKFFGMVVTYIQIAIRHTGFFFTNLFRMISSFVRRK